LEFHVFGEEAHQAGLDVAKRSLDLADKAPD
jgi:hypothetical protein